MPGLPCVLAAFALSYMPLRGTAKGWGGPLTYRTQSTESSPVMGLFLFLLAVSTFLSKDNRSSHCRPISMSACFPEPHFTLIPETQDPTRAREGKEPLTVSLGAVGGKPRTKHQQLVLLFIPPQNTD